jgi:hypothetical protein
MTSYSVTGSRSLPPSRCCSPDPDDSPTASQERACFRSPPQPATPTVLSPPPVASPLGSRPTTPPTDIDESPNESDPLLLAVPLPQEIRGEAVEQAAQIGQQILSQDTSLLKGYEIFFGSPPEALSRGYLSPLAGKLQEMLDQMKIGKGTIGENGLPLSEYLNGLSNAIQTSGDDLEKKCLLMMEMIVAAPGMPELIKMAEAKDTEGRIWHFVAIALSVATALLLTFATGGAALVLLLLILGIVSGVASVATSAKGLLTFRKREYQQAYADKDSRGNLTELGKLRELAKGLFELKASLEEGHLSLQENVSYDSDLQRERYSLYAHCRQPTRTPDISIDARPPVMKGIPA